MVANLQWRYHGNDEHWNEERKRRRRHARMANRLLPFPRVKRYRRMARDGGHIAIVNGDGVACVWRSIFAGKQARQGKASTEQVGW
jgi:hypothetical protein